MKPIEHNPTGTGTWAHDDLRKTSASEVGVGADADLPLSVRFVASVAKLVRTRRASSAGPADAAVPAVFLLAPSVDSLHLPAVPKRVPRLQAGLEAVTGRLWFVSAAAVTGRYLEFDFQGVDELFNHVTDTLKLGAVPAVFYDPRETPATVAFYAEGLSQEEDVEEYPLEGVDVSLDKVFDVINHIHARHLLTPEAQGAMGQLWIDRDKGWPVKKAEETVQLYLQVGLSTAFPTCTIRVEQTQTSGRLDLEIEESDFKNPSLVTRHALLELKVLRSFGSTGTPHSPKSVEDWITKGMEQAATYRDERGVRHSALCCFDMRSNDTGDACFTHVSANAATLAVALRRWYLFSTSEAHRALHVARRLGA